jgi:dihydrofolate synthase / folylpolyglutamate synthase
VIDARPAETFAEAEDALLSRWPETKLEPSLDRIRALMALLGDPQLAYPVIQLTGTNGKTSTARMIDALIGAHDLRTGRFTSPHVEKMTERISIDGEPLTDEKFVLAFNDVAPYTLVVDANQPVPLSFFETVVGMAYAAFADAPVDVAVVEVGMGGAWDATSVCQPTVSVVTPIGLDHMLYLGDTIAEIAQEKSGIIKPGCTAVIAEQEPDALAILLARAAEVDAPVLLEGRDFTVDAQATAVGGVIVTITTQRATYADLFVPLHGAHQAQNVALALVAVESFLDRALSDEVVTAGVARVASPGRLEVIRRSPTVVLDAAHNPHGALATATAIEESFNFSPLIGVVGVMGDKDVEGLLAAFEPHFAHLVCTENSQSRSLPASQLAALAAPLFGEDRVTTRTELVDAIEHATALAEAPSESAGSIGTGAVLVTGSVVTVGEARAMLKRQR